MKNIHAFLSAGCASLLFVGVASAAVFPDVPDGHIHQDAIENLVDSSVLSGNPDGRFYPNKPVNRAELLKMLYKAAGHTPDVTSVRCFPDVQSGSWYEQFVCDAAANGYVNGYPDGTFHPGQQVNRVEALKMIMNILGLDVSEISLEDRESVKFVDVSVSAWYTKYLYGAYTRGILPIPGMDGSRFHPESPLLRGEAAAMVHAAVVAKMESDRMSSSSQRSSESSVSQGTSSSASSSVATSDGNSSSSRAQDTTQEVSFPFDVGGKFNERQSYVYHFSLSSRTTVYTHAKAQAGGLTCRLYLLEDDGFSEEYYLGHEQGQSCYLHTALQPGNYQLQLQSEVADDAFQVTTETRDGDGNDGYVEAKRLLRNTPKTATLGVNDLQDFYIFTVSEETTMTLESTNAPDVSCAIFPAPDVDIFGFSGPKCNQSYSYPPGTYYVVIDREAALKTSKETYTLTLR